MLRAGPKGVKCGIPLGIPYRAADAVSSPEGIKYGIPLGIPYRAADAASSPEGIKYGMPLGIPYRAARRYVYNKQRRTAVWDSIR